MTAKLRALVRDAIREHLFLGRAQENAILQSLERLLARRRRQGGSP